MKILVTGAAGFIGYHVTKKLLENGYEVVGVDNLSNYYDTNLKLARLQDLGIPISDAKKERNECISTITDYPFSFVRLDIGKKEQLTPLFAQHHFDVVCNLAAQAGVRYSLEHPDVYMESNFVGFLNILESCRHNKITHLVYASSSSVYGLSKNIPFQVEDNVDLPISLYAVSKRSNELMAHAYSHLFHFATTGLRFFTVYGPWGRPDMAPYLFTSAIAKGEPISVFNHGKMERDFTFVKDIAEGVVRVIAKKVQQRLEEQDYYKIYNIGNNKAVSLMDFINEIEKNLNTKAKMKMLPIQPGDIERTWANVEGLIKDYGYSPKTTLKDGIKEYVTWFKSYYNISLDD
ncbi:MAG: NAD-dependent epimerase/dehydratase family protein [Bacteroidota bacterium]